MRCAPAAADIMAMVRRIMRFSRQRPCMGLSPRTTRMRLQSIPLAPAYYGNYEYGGYYGGGGYRYFVARVGVRRGFYGYSARVGVGAICPTGIPAAPPL